MDPAKAAGALGRVHVGAMAPAVRGPELGGTAAPGSAWDLRSCRLDCSSVAKALKAASNEISTHEYTPLYTFKAASNEISCQHPLAVPSSL